MKTTRLVGHELPNEGAIYGPGYFRIRGDGVTRCTCGKASPILPSDNARKVWHREHKAELQAREQQEIEDHAAAVADDQERERLDDLDRSEAEAWYDE